MCPAWSFRYLSKFRLHEVINHDIIVFVNERLQRNANEDVKSHRHALTFEN